MYFITELIHLWVFIWQSISYIITYVIVRIERCVFLSIVAIYYVVIVCTSRSSISRVISNIASLILSLSLWTSWGVGAQTCSLMKFQTRKSKWLRSGDHASHKIRRTFASNLSVRIMFIQPLRYITRNVDEITVMAYIQWCFVDNLFQYTEVLIYTETEFMQILVCPILTIVTMKYTMVQTH